MKSRETDVTAGFLQQLWDIQWPFNVIGNLYFREDIDTLSPGISVVPTEDKKCVLGSTVAPFMFAGGRKLAKVAGDTIRASKNLKTISTKIFLPHPYHFTLRHSDLSLANILVDPATYKATGVFD